MYGDSPVEMAPIWQDKGAERIHIVDLDGSLHGSPKNKNVISQIIKTITVPVQIGGGIRDMATVEEYLQMRASVVIIGTAALEKKDFIAAACKLFGKQIILDIDALNEMVAVEGWTQKTNTPAA